MAYSVFVSYSTRDLATATALRDWIVYAGAEAFLAEYSTTPGQPLSERILQAIKGCDLFLLLWSSSARGSDWVPQEIGVAKGASKPIMPVVLHHGLDLTGFVKDLKYLPLYKDPNAAAQWLSSHVAALKKDKEVKGLLALGVAGAILFALSSGKK